MTFVCARCRDGNHDQCPGGTWCDCAHRTLRQVKSHPCLSTYRVWAAPFVTTMRPVTTPTPSTYRICSPPVTSPVRAIRFLIDVSDRLSATCRASSDHPTHLASTHLAP